MRAIQAIGLETTVVGLSHCTKRIVDFRTGRGSARATLTHVPYVITLCPCQKVVLEKAGVHPSPRRKCTPRVLYGNAVSFPTGRTWSRKDPSNSRSP